MIEIRQKPKYETMPAAQPIIFVVAQDVIVQAESNVRFVCEVYASHNYSTITNSSNLRATLKTTPNGSGVGIFDVRSVLESQVSPDHLATNEIINTTYDTSSTFKNQPFDTNPTAQTPLYFPVHIQDKYSLGVNSTSWFRLKFKIEYLGGDSNFPNNVNVDTNENRSSETYMIFNGVVYNEDNLKKTSLNYNYGLNLLDINGTNIIANDTLASSITNAPTTQYARIGDYGTVSLFSAMESISKYSFTTGDVANNDTNVNITIKAYDSSNSLLFTEIIANQVTVSGVHNGGSGGYVQNYSYGNLLFCGIFPGNLKNYSTQWQTNESNISYYTFQGTTDIGTKVTKLYTINIICEDGFGYEGIRLAWLNRFGAWDYYTFNKKSTRSISTKKNQFTQLHGTWNDAVWKPSGFLGGKKNFRSNTTEKIKLNTDYLTDEESSWILELIQSPEVYIINSYKNDDTSTGILNKYVEPVLLTTSNFVKKTKANDRLIQYTIDIERNKQQRIQSI